MGMGKVILGLGIILTASILIAGCGKQESEKIRQDLKQVKEELEQVNSNCLGIGQEVKQIKQEIKQIKETQKVDSAAFIELLAEQPYTSCWLDPTAKGFQRLDTLHGSFLIVCKDVKPYLNGYKITINIGNLSTAQYNGFSLKIKYCKKTIETAGGSRPSEWYESMREKNVSFNDDLNPGSWNTVEFVISPAKAEDIGCLKLSMETKRLSLFK